MWYFHDDVGWGWMVFGSVWMVVFWGAIIGLVIWGVKQATGNRREGGMPGEAPLEIAQRRLAHGEITREEFEELRKALQ